MERKIHNKHEHKCHMCMIGIPKTHIMRSQDCLKNVEFLYWDHLHHESKTMSKGTMKANMVSLEKIKNEKSPSLLAKMLDCGCYRGTLPCGPFGWRGMTSLSIMLDEWRRHIKSFGKNCLSLLELYGMWCGKRWRGLSCMMMWLASMTKYEEGTNSSTIEETLEQCTEILGPTRNIKRAWHPL